MVVGGIEVARALPPGVTVVRNERWAGGIATSLAAGIGAARAGGHGAVVVGLGDQPFIDPAAWQAVAAAEETPMAVATYDGRARATRCGWRPRCGVVLPMLGDEGARPLLRAAARARLRGTVPGFGRRHRHRGGSDHVELTNEFRVGVPVERAWAVLTDLERIAPCMPGAELQEVEGDEYRGDRQGQGRADHGPVQGGGVLRRASTRRTGRSCGPKVGRPAARAAPAPSSRPCSRPTATPPR